MLITPNHCRAARLLLQWDQDELVVQSKVSIATIRRFENGIFVSEHVRHSIRKALENAGIIFVLEGEEMLGHKVELGIGLRLGKRGKPVPKVKPE